MAFLTGVDIEGQGRRNEEHQLVRRRPSPSHVHSGSVLQLLDRNDVEYGGLLKNARALADDGDPMGDLWKMIRKTRAKMDNQRNVLNGFIADVNEIKSMDRNFNTSDLALMEDSPKQAAISSSAPVPPAILGKSSSTPAVRRAALTGYPTGNSDALALPSASSAPSSRRPSSGDKSRGLALRGGGGSGTKSSPALAQAITGGLHQQAPLKVPVRRPAPESKAANRPPPPTNQAEALARRGMPMAGSGASGGSVAEVLASFPSLSRRTKVR